MESSASASPAPTVARVDCPTTEGATTRGAERTLGGAEGTVRVGVAAGADGTVRVGVAAGADGTVRVEGAVRVEGTVRVGVAAGADLVCACTGVGGSQARAAHRPCAHALAGENPLRSEEHTSELQSRTVISYAVFCLRSEERLRKEIGRAHV